MSPELRIDVQRWPIAGSFTISRGSKTEAAIVVCTLSEDGLAGQGECVPYARYGESLESVYEQIEAVRSDLRNGIGRTELLAVMQPGAARNAVDCALWDLEAKQGGNTVAAMIGTPNLVPLVTAMTVSFGDAQTMAEAARKQSHRKLLKVKVGGENDAERIRAVTAAAPQSRIIVDANEGWTDENIVENLLAAAKAGVALIEQPLPAGKDAILGKIPHPVPICADESVHATGDLATLIGRYDCVNIKLDKTGGLTEALHMRNHARKLGFGVMVGCMVGTSLGMAPAVLLAQDADYVDLDGPLLLAKDRDAGLTYRDSLVFPPEASLWG
ncbi:MAG: N-acetyl-D-Glu racemase DgcA [Phyllobacterium sp.]